LTPKRDALRDRFASASCPGEREGRIDADSPCARNSSPWPPARSHAPARILPRPDVQPSARKRGNLRRAQSAHHAGIFMRLSVVTVSLTLTLVSPIYAKDCTLTDEEWIGHEYPSLKSWSKIYTSYRSYTPQCDDGFMAEGYTHAMVKALSAHWEKFDDFARLARQDAAFRRFALKHVDASADPDDLRKVFTNATRRCPRDLGGLCASVANAAKAALKASNG
jgi:hypothetical protein